MKNLAVLALLYAVASGQERSPKGLDDSLSAMLIKIEKISDMIRLRNELLVLEQAYIADSIRRHPSDAPYAKKFYMRMDLIKKRYGEPLAVEKGIR